MFQRTSIVTAVVGVLFLACQAMAEGLPDFTELVEDHSPSVVKITTSTAPVERSAQPDSNQQVPEFFRYFFMINCRRILISSGLIQRQERGSAQVLFSLKMVIF